MKKVFPLQVSGRDDARVRDKIRQEINKYVRRERNKPLPDGFTQWMFDCRVGPDREQGETRALKDVGHAVDAVAATGAREVYVEIVAVPGNRRAAP